MSPNKHDISDPPDLLLAMTGNIVPYIDQDYLSVMLNHFLLKALAWMSDLPQVDQSDVEIRQSIHLTQFATNEILDLHTGFHLILTYLSL